MNQYKNEYLRLEKEINIKRNQFNELQEALKNVSNFLKKIKDLF